MYRNAMRLVAIIFLLCCGSPAAAADLLQQTAEAIDHAVYELQDATADERLAALKAAVVLAEEAVSEHPDSAQALVLLARARGEVARRSGIFQNLSVAPRLKEYFERALELEPENPDALVGFALWHLEIAEAGAGWLYGADRADVLPLLAEAVRLAPERVNLRVEYADALIRLKQPDEARAQLEAALSLPAVSTADRREQERAAALLEDL